MPFSIPEKSSSAASVVVPLPSTLVTTTPAATPSAL
jgi:hypothetical protein